MWDKAVCLTVIEFFANKNNEYHIDREKSIKIDGIWIGSRRRNSTFKNEPITNSTEKRKNGNVHVDS